MGQNENQVQLKQITRTPTNQRTNPKYHSIALHFFVFWGAWHSRKGNSPQQLSLLCIQRWGNKDVGLGGLLAITFPQRTCLTRFRETLSKGFPSQGSSVLESKQPFGLASQGHLDPAWPMKLLHLLLPEQSYKDKPPKPTPYIFWQLPKIPDGGTTTS